MLDLTHHKYSTLAGSFQNLLEYSDLFFICQVVSAPSSTRWRAAIANRITVDESVPLLADPADGQAGHLSGLLQTYREPKR